MPVITIARQYGAGGSSVGRLVAERLGAEFVDKWLIAEVARRAALPAALVEAEDEHPSRLLARVIASFGPLAAGAGLTWDVPYPGDAYEPRLAILELTRNVILEVARTGNAVIVGRGGSVVLRDHRDATHVFLYADDAIRAETVMAREVAAASVARRRMHEIDANRAAYLRQVHGVDWRDPLGYTLLLNTGALGYERTAETILSVAQRGAPGSSFDAAPVREVLHERWGDDDARDAHRCQLAVEGVAGRPRLVGHRQPDVRSAEAVDELAHRRRIVGDLAVILGVAEGIRHRDCDRRLVDVKPDEPRSLLHWTGLPHVALCGLHQAARAIHDGARVPVLPC